MIEGKFEPKKVPILINLPKKVQISAIFSQCFKLTLIINCVKGVAR